MLSLPDSTGADPSSTPRVAVLTMVRNEADMLPRWIEYYGHQVGVENLIVVDDNSDDGSTDDLPCARIRLPAEPWRVPWGQTRITLANSVSRGLLACYEAVIFADADEFLVPDPDRYASLIDYVGANQHRELIAPLGLNVLHDPLSEPTLDPARPMMEQRRFVKFVSGMCKPLIKCVPAAWVASFHGLTKQFVIDRDLLLLHLKYADVDSLVRTSERRFAWHQEGRGHPSSAWALSPDDLESRLLSWVQVPEGEAAPEFDPNEPDLSEVVAITERGHFRSWGIQLEAMERNPLRQLPDRFRSAF